MEDKIAAVMSEAIALGGGARRTAPPNPWVGGIVLDAEGRIVGRGATEEPGGRHAEIVALEEAGALAAGGTLVVTLEPCSHHGRTPPCTDAVIAAGVARVVIALEDPDLKVHGSGIARLREAGLAVELGVEAEAAERSLAPYLHHRRSGRPLVVLKLATTLDGFTAAPDGSSRWITGEAARRDVHEIRADSEAILVGAGTIRADDPELTARTEPPSSRQPLRLVLGDIPPGSACEPAESLAGDLGEILDELGGRGILQLLVEGGATVAKSFFEAGLVDRMVVYLAPALFGGDDARPQMLGPGAGTMGDLWRGRFVSVAQLGEDLRVEVEA